MKKIVPAGQRRSIGGIIKENRRTLKGAALATIATSRIDPSEMLRSEMRRLGTTPFDCKNPAFAHVVDCVVDDPDFLGDGWCDHGTGSPVYNTEACNFDGGDWGTR